MFSVDDLYKAMAAGESADSLAKKYTEALNAAIQKVKEEEERKAKEAEAKALAKEKEDAVLVIYDLICDYIENYLPEIYDFNLRDQCDAEELVKMIDSAYQETAAALNVLKFRTKDKSKSEIKKMISDEESLRKFLKDNNLLF